ncbi:MAG: two-component sensor histidine kinase [Gammaproteobacteria bacterium]|nr:MAG: two-component sensor histidine kinase [Gammaproteobacteria bacterium]
MLNKLSLFKKLSLSALIIFLILVVGFVWISQAIESVSRAQAEQELHRDLAAHLVHDNPLISSEQLNSDTIGNLFHSMMILGANFEFYVLDNSGKIINFSAKPNEIIRKIVNLEPLNNFIQNSQQFPIYADDPRGNEGKIFSAAIIHEGDKKIGYLFVIVRSKIYDSVFNRLKNNQQLKTILLVAATSILFLFALIFLSLHFFVQPLRDLTKAINSMQQNGFKEKLSLIEVAKSSSEINILTDAFNQMIAQTNQQFDQLKLVDAERRELLTHLSHDLRTPLSSLQGFLETISLKQDQLEPKKRQEYIERSLKNAQRLKHFVDQIFELAHLESGHVSANFETFPIAEILYDLKEKFSIKVDKKKITLQVKLKNEKIQTSTDIGKLERVLNNLIENAIRHTPENGVISLELVETEINNQVQIIVRDTGIGIPEDEIPYLFDARYRGSKTAEDGERHIGLGLTITKKLLNILGSEIKVKNNDGSGASFSFQLTVI